MISSIRAGADGLRAFHLPIAGAPFRGHDHFGASCLRSALRGPGKVDTTSSEHQGHASVAATAVALKHGLRGFFPTVRKTALAEATPRGVSAGAVTPFVIDRIAAATDGRTVRANLALVEYNAAVAVAVAAAVAGALRASES